MLPVLLARLCRADLSWPPIIVGDVVVGGGCDGGGVGGGYATFQVVHLRSSYPMLTNLMLTMTAAAIAMTPTLTLTR